jgi:hypothetical protein
MKNMVKLILVLTLVSCWIYASDTSSPPPVPSEEEPEVLNEGPMHEAFAQPVELDPQASIIAQEEPPSEIIENPSQDRPKSSSYVWIPGYWAWDAEREGYIWISGCWRIPPVNMSWVPGYWNRVSDGWQWVPGFWIPTSRASQVEYLPKPPELVDTRPVVVSASVEEIWVPPCYYWRNNQYILRAGYWLEPNDKWVWVPSHYTWTPYGYVFVAGYWDHVLTTRGVLYAPVYFPRRIHRERGYTYHLSVVVNVGNLQFSLFSNPRYCHYYFGDYYGDTYVSMGIYPWFEFETVHTWYDPIFEYQRWHYRRTVPHWGEYVRREYDLRRSDINLRPPRTYRELEVKLARTDDRQRRDDYRMVAPLREQIENNRTTIQFSRMNNREQDRIVNKSSEVNIFRQERSRIENNRMSREGTQPVRQPGMIEQRSPERIPGIPSSPSGRVGTDNSPARPGRSPDISVRQGASMRSAPEILDFPKSPVSGRRTGGLGDLFRSNNSPSRPDSESRVNRNIDDSGRSREGEGSSGRGRR